MIYIVCGLPGSGKTTWVQQSMGNTDVAYDFDYMFAAITYQQLHTENRPDKQASVANNLLYSMIGQYKRSGADDLYIIRIRPENALLVALANEEYKIIILETSTEECKQRLKARDGTVADFFDSAVVKLRYFEKALKTMAEIEVLRIAPPLCGGENWVGTPRKGHSFQ